MPETVTVKVGAATIAIAGQSFGVCVGEPERPPARVYAWKIADSTVVAVSVIDSIHARITGLRPGPTLVTPSYVSGGDALTSIQVTVVP